MKGEDGGMRNGDGDAGIWGITLSESRSMSGPPDRYRKSYSISVPRAVANALTQSPLATAPVLTRRIKNPHS